MKSSEFLDILLAIFLFTIVNGVPSIINAQWSDLPKFFFFSALLIFVVITSKKIVAYLLDSDVEHEIWKMSRFGLGEKHQLKKEIPAGIIFPLLFSIVTLGSFKLLTFLTYESRALKVRAAKRFGFYSYTEMTDWHNGIIGTAGMLPLFALAIIFYLINEEYLSAITSFYTFFNLLPFSKLDGTQIFFGSRVLWAILMLISLIFSAYSLQFYI